jgi:hypothetical protein
VVAAADAVPRGRDFFLCAEDESGTRPEPDLETRTGRLRNPPDVALIASARRERTKKEVPMNRKALSLAALLGTLLLAAPSLLAEERCTLRSIAGDYGYTVTGVRNPFGPAASVGILHLDQHGNLTGSQTLTINGTIVQGEVLNGTLTVNDDCTSSSVITVSNTPFPRTSHLDTVWVKGGTAFRSVFTDSGTTLTVEGDRIRHGDD